MSRRAKALRRSAEQPPFPQSARGWRLPQGQDWIAPGLAALACLLYASSWRFGFVGDDSFVIQNNAWTKQGLSALWNTVSHSLYFGAVPQNGGLYRPVAGAYYVLVGALVDLRPAGYHVAQILLYGLNVGTAFVFFTRLGLRGLAVPVVATVLFLVHPIHTEVVNNIKSADEMLCLQFLLVSAIAWLRFADTASTRWRLISLATYALAVCSKETAVPMVVVLPALWYFFRNRSVRASLIAAVPFAVVAVAYLGLRHLVLTSEPPTNIVTILNNALLATNDGSTRFASALAYLVLYVRMLFWPHPLSFDYSHNAIPLHTFHDPVVWVATLLLAGLLAVFVIGFRARRVEAFAVLWCGASMVLVSNVFFLISTNFGERLLYLPSLLFCYVAAHWLFKTARITEMQPLASTLRTPRIAAPLVAVVLLAGVADIRRTREWRDQASLFGADVRKFPNSARLNNYLGSVLYFEGERLLGQPDFADIAVTDFTNAKKHLLKGLQILDKFQDVHAALGMAQYRLKEYSEAIPNLQRSIEFTVPRDYTIPMLADAYRQVGTPDRAIALYKWVDTEGINYPAAWFELGKDAVDRHDDDTSIRYLGKFLIARPADVTARQSLASALYRKGLHTEALAQAEQCVALNPPSRDAAHCLLLGADILMRTGHPTEAMEHYERAKVLDPANPWIRK